MSVSGFTLFLPDPLPSGSPTLTWGNGTGGQPVELQRAAQPWASWGIIVVASNSGSTGTGSQMVQGITVIQNGGFGASNYVCTAGHSQGGSGTVNAARDSRVDCTMPIQPDNRFTATSNGRDLSGKPSLILCGSSDTLAPCGSTFSTRNGSGLFNQSSGPAAIVTRTGAGHFEPTGSGQNDYTGISTAWLVGNMFGDGRRAGAVLRRRARRSCRCPAGRTSASRACRSRRPWSDPAGRGPAGTQPALLAVARLVRLLAALLGSALRIASIMRASISRTSSVSAVLMCVSSASSGPAMRRIGRTDGSGSLG